MSNQMLLESVPRQTRIAVLEEDRLVELYVERGRDQGLVGNVYKGIVHRVLPGMQAAFVDIGLERDAFLYAGDVREEVELETGETEEAPLPSIADLLQPGQQIEVQVVRDPLPGKGARVTTRVSLPGRCLVLLGTSSHLGVSRRIEDEEERERLTNIMGAFPESPWGFIVRTAGEGQEAAAFESDREYLQRLWERIRSRGASVKAPSLLHREPDLALRVVRDVFDESFRVLWVEGEEPYARIVEFLDQVQPELVGRVRLHRGEQALYRRFGLEKEIDNALEPKVWLRSGGYIVIHPTEALVAIDVNTGRYVGRHDLEETILRTNLEAVDETVRQIRLRNLAGIIVIDLIDMEVEEHREQVFAALEREMARDRARNKVLDISEFGLVQITRKRSRPTLERFLTRACPYCRGRGRIQNLTSICLHLRKEILTMRSTVPSDELLVRVHPEVARALQNEEREILVELEDTLGATLLLQADPELHREHFDVLEV